MASPAQQFSAAHTVTGSGIPEPRPIHSYRAVPVPPVLCSPRSNYPSNSALDSRDSRERLPPLGAYRFIETAGAVDYRPVNLPPTNTGGIPQSTLRREELPDVEMEVRADGLRYLKAPERRQHPNFRTTNRELGSRAPERLASQEHRYFPRAHTFTNTFSGGVAGTPLNFRSFGLNTAKDEVRVHRVEFFG